MNATVLRLAGVDRLIVRLEATGAVVELHLSQPVHHDLIPRAHMVTPLRPARAAVIPGEFRNGVFWGSEATVWWPERRAVERRPKRPATDELEREPRAA